jgi:hypothetical protein
MGQEGFLMASRSRHSWLLMSIAALSFALCSRSQAQVIHPDQEIQVHNLPSLVARSHDGSDVLLTSLDTVFHDRKICCGRDSALEDSAAAADPKSLKDASRLEGRHLLSDGRPIKVAAEYLTAGEVSAGHVISMILNQHAALMLWNSHLYVVYGVVFFQSEDTSTDTTSVVIRKFLLWDTRYSDARRTIVFDRATEDPAQVQGLLFLQAESPS